MNFDDFVKVNQTVKYKNLKTPFLSLSTPICTANFGVSTLSSVRH